jgi:hypothetical protein
MKWSPLNKDNGRKTYPTPTTLATQLRPYIFAALGVLTVTLIETTFVDVFERVVLFGYWPVVIFSGWVGGLWPGLFATVLSVAAANYYIMPTQSRSDADGRVRFTGVASGPTVVMLDGNDWRAAAEIGGGAIGAPLEPGAGDEDLATSNVIPGSYELEVTLAGRKRRFPVDVKSGATNTVVVHAP